MAGLLTYSPLAGLPVLVEQWQGSALGWVRGPELTAAGTVQVFHLIPFSFLTSADVLETLSGRNLYIY